MLRTWNCIYKTCYFGIKFPVSPNLHRSHHCRLSPLSSSERNDSNQRTAKDAGDNAELADGVRAGRGRGWASARRSASRLRHQSRATNGVAACRRHNRATSCGPTCRGARAD